MSGEPMKYVNRVVGRDGKERLYLRKKGFAATPLKSAWGTLELELEVEAAIKALTPAKPLPGRLAGALRAYELESADFRGLAESTKYEYRLLMKELERDFGTLDVSSFTAAFVLELRNLWAPRGHRAANMRLQVLKNVLWPSVITKLIDHDPFSLIPQVRRPENMGEPHILWPDDVLAAVLNTALEEKRFGLARAVAIARYTGARRSDIVKMTKGVRVNGRLVFLSGKRKVLVDIAEDPELTYLLATIPSSQPNEPRNGRKVPAGVVKLPGGTLVFNMANERYSDDGLGLELRKLVERLYKAEKIDSPEYDLHGLRHTRGVELALAGCTDSEGAAMLGHRSASSFAQYRRQAERVRSSDNAAAKVAAFRERTPNSGVQNRVQNKCKTETPKRGRNIA